MELNPGPQCFSCGGHLSKTESGKFKCDYCGSEYSREGKSELSGEIINQLDIANNYRMLLRFDDAAETYEAIIARYPSEVFAYWGAFLSEYGIEYVKSGEDYRPISHKISRIPATSSPYLKKLYSITEESERQSYRMKAEQVESIRYSTYELSRTQQPYDIFICHSGGRKESECAAVLYDELIKSGRKVFLPQLSVPDGATKEAYIFNAIDTSKYMIVIAESIDSIDGTTNIWSRFIALENKKIKVVHAGLNESDFPHRLRRVVQRQPSINLLTSDWLTRTLAFTKEEESKDKEKVVVIKEELDDKRLSDLERRLDAFSKQSSGILDAFTALMTYISLGNVAEAERTLNFDIERFAPEELKLVSSLCLELLKMTKCNEFERQNFINKVSAIAGKIRGEYPALTEAERALYPLIKNDDFLIYLSKCFGVIKDRDRQCFVLDLVDCSALSDFARIGEFITMLFANKRYEDVKEALRLIPKVDGDRILPMFLSKYEGNKQIVLMSIASKIFCSDKITDELNEFLCGCDDLGLCLTLTEIMTRNDLKLSVTGLSGALSKINEPRDVRVVLDNFGNRAISGAEVDKLVSIATNSDEVANEVLGHLKYHSGISDLGPYNMQQLVLKCNLSAIKLRLFDFALDKKLAEKLLLDAIKEGGEDRLSTINILAGFVPVVDIEQYSSVLLGPDPIKYEIAKVLAPKTGKFASVNKVLIKLLSGRDDDELKRNIFALYRDFPLDEATKKAYLNILPDFYDETYELILKDFLAEYPSEATELFVLHYERLISGYENVLPIIVSAIKYAGEDLIVRFVTEYKGSQRVKDELISKLWRFMEKPKKLTVKMGNLECNLLQAYLLTVREDVPSVRDAVALMERAGLNARDKVVASGKKLKFRDYVPASPIGEANKALVTKFI